MKKKGRKEIDDDEEEEEKRTTTTQHIFYEDDINMWNGHVFKRKLIQLNIRVHHIIQDL